MTPISPNDNAELVFTRRMLMVGFAGSAILLSTEAHATTTNYAYDGVGRMMAAVLPNDGGTNFVYDAAGNRTLARGGPFVSRLVDGNCFDPQYYTIVNTDVANAGVDPYQHYTVYGYHEGRDPSGFFSTAGYLNAYSDVSSAGANPLSHYSTTGWKQKRNPSGLFSTSKYLAAYADISAANINPLEHFLQYGVFEGRQSFGDGTYPPAS